ncbi:coiled-coil domain-containing protein [Polaromonas naphthalenivorans]|uniref:Putative ATPase involved in DNA repair n=1 Tax=Polaromonas naphthalenivorans (strain CJ2) TaxID=365044 RepID=A1VVC4_POLNA|nr:DNA repair ATPase [Polaromonas naphthalenivorans]ABM39602.1 putative ATPase involved in DNA repair [Polaromonas naphthalenivorans CJ2]
MQVNKLMLEHFEGIERGRGKDRIEVDFTKVNPNAKLVALFGPNGSCKTTLMDNMHPYRVMPSRATSPTPTAFSYYLHVIPGKNALKDIFWSHKGREFRSVIRIRTTGKTNKQECYLTERVGEDFLPYEDTTGLVSDGKTDTYDRAVEAILGKPEVFFATQFSAQGKKPISTMTAGEVKALMAAMLIMGSFKTLSEKANEVVKGLKPHLSAFQSQLLPLETKILKEQSLIELRGNLQREMQVNAEKVLRQKSLIKEGSATLSALELKLSQQESVLAQRSSLQMQLGSVVSQNAAELAAFEAKQVAERKSVEAADQNSRNAVRVAQSAYDDASLRVTETMAVIATEKEIEQARVFHQTNVPVLNRLRGQQTDLYVDINKFNELTQLVAKMRESFAADRQTGIAMSEAVETARQIAALIGEVPCAGHRFSGSCKLLAEANGAAVGLAGRQAKVVELRTRLQGDQVRIKNNNAELQRLIQVNAEREVLLGKIAALELALSNAKAVLKGAPALEKAKQQLDSYRQSALQAKSDLANAKTIHTAALGAVNNILAKQQGDKSIFMSVLYKEKDRIQSAISELPVLIQDYEVNEARKAWQYAELMLENEEKLRDGLVSRFNNVVLSISDIAASNAKISQVTSVCDAISNEISQWSLLSRAMGNDGIIAMSIDDAGPEISALCNSLLKDCAGGRFNISLSTQAATAGGTLKEAFLINVEDVVRGGEPTELNFMSGGEKVWINECLVRAMALYMSQTTASSFKTLFSDEADGPLDPERKRQYMAMKRTVLERGGYDREFIITQTPELLLMCDQVIDVTKL